jgi:hypothetical protein
MSQSMIEFIQDIEKDRDANDIKVRQLERITGIDRCTIEDGLSGKKKEMKLENFISIVNVIYKEVSIRPQTQHRLVNREFCNNQIFIIQIYYFLTISDM